ncbi:MAG: hypothetical protein JXB85_06850 [Anaerolineales bacterium]|nr:hypothetical protein [Anaerolineales bacterium]
MARQTKTLNLANLFQSVAGNLVDHRNELNAADTYNHDHGDNMVEVFNVISQAMREKKNAAPADQLAYASQLLRQGKSGSSQVYAKGLSKAATEFQNQKQVTPDNALKLIQTLMGGGQETASQTQSGIGDLLGTLLGGGQATPQTAQNQPADAGIDVGDLLNAGMSFLNTKSQGGSNLEALVNALVSDSAMGDSSHRSQSGALVINTLLQAIGRK